MGDGVLLDIKSIPDLLTRTNAAGKKEMCYLSNPNNGYAAEGTHHAWLVPHDLGAPRGDWVEPERGTQPDARLQGIYVLEYLKYEHYRDEHCRPQRLHYYPIFMCQVTENGRAVEQFIRGDFYAKLFKNWQTRFHDSLGSYNFV